MAQRFAIQVIAVADEDEVSLRQTRTGANEAFKDRRVGHRFVVSRPNQRLFVSDAGKIVENALVKRVLHDYVLRAAVDKRVRAERTGAIAVTVILDFHDSDERGEEFLHRREFQRRLEKCGGKQVSDQRLAEDPDGWMHACLPKETENRGLQNCAPDDTALKYGLRMRTRPAVCDLPVTPFCFRSSAFQRLQHPRLRRKRLYFIAGRLIEYDTLPHGLQAFREKPRCLPCLTAGT